VIRLTQKRNRRDPSRALSSTLVVPCPNGLKYDSYQLAGIEYALPRKSTLIGDEPGLGKTIQAIGLANFLKLRKILVICPGFLKEHWLREFNKWKILSWEVKYVVDGKSTEFGDVVIINYELLKKHRDHLRAVDWDLIIVDEVHKIKNKRTDRTREIWGGIKRNEEGKIVERVSPIRAAKYVYLTGTPALNGKPKELWPLIQQCDPTGLGSDWFSFAKRYCKLIELTRFDPRQNKYVRIGWKWDGCENEEELQARMRLIFMVRRLKEDVMKDLKPKIRQVIPIPTNGKIQKALLEEIRLFDEYAKGRDISEIELPEFGEFASKMQEIGLAIVQPTIEVIEHESSNHDKIVIICYHNEVARQIAAHLDSACVLINGDVRPTKRQALVDRFQNDPEIHYAVGTEGSCREGFTMTAARLMILTERSWVPGNVTQVEDRIHRRGQKEQVIYKHLVLAGSLADRQIYTLIDKQERNDKMLDKQTEIV
jgi:SWI/SNF-related matrix-associated actin-dependent regulator 1 of chromatin subfamily A